MKRFLLVFLLTLAVLPVFAQVKPHTFSPNDPVSSAKINSNYDVIYQWCQELATQALTLYSKALYSSSDTSSPYWHKNNDGSGSGLDADLLDGKDSTAFASSTHTHNYAGSSSAGGAANSVARTLTRGTGLTGNNFNGSAATTWAVSYGTTAGTACQGNDARLSNARTPTSHTHGSITNDGKVGTTANLPLITGTGGVVQAGSFGTAANTFCQGNDSRLSNARTPTAHNHDASNITAGTLPAARIGANSITNDKLSNAALKMPAGAILELSAKGSTTTSIARAGGVIDVSGNGNHGQAYGGSQISSLSRGLSFSFNGTNAYANVKNPLATNASAFSIAFRFYSTDATTRNYGLAISRTLAGKGIAVFVLGNKLRFDAGSQWQTNITIAPMMWHDLVVTYRQGVAKKAYLDGVEVGTTATAEALENVDGARLNIGASLVSGVSAGNFLEGHINRMYVFGRALTPEEIKTLYMLGSSSTIGRITADLVEPDEIWTKNDLTTATAGTANTVALRDGSGDITTRLFRSTYADQTTTPATTIGLAFRNSTTDNYIRFMTAEAFKAWLLSAKIGVVQTSAPASPVNGDIWIE